MTLQQLKYIIAIDQHRNFARAAAELNITQPTLSSLLIKLEEELGVRIFDRSNKNVNPTAIGEKIIQQARQAINEAYKINEMVAEQKEQISGYLSLGVGPTIAPYIVPAFIRKYTAAYPGIILTVNEMKSDAIIRALQSGNIDIGIAIRGHATPGIDEIPLYTEPFWVYVAETCLRDMPSFRPSDLEHEKMWIMKESQCMRDSAFSFCKARSAGRRIYEAGSIDTLIRIVDMNGGFTIIPEMHLPFLTDRQKNNIRPIEGRYVSKRQIAIYIRHDFIRKLTLKSVIDTLLTLIPSKMIEKDIKNI